MSAGGRLVTRALPELDTVRAVLADRGYRGRGKMAAPERPRHPGPVPTAEVEAAASPVRPLRKVEHAFARLGRWRRLSRCREESAESARG